MITKDIATYAHENWTGYLKTAKELSMNGKGDSLVQDQTLMYCFDDVVASMFPADCRPDSADALYPQKGGPVLLIEFKSGFHRRLTKDNWDKEKAKCPYLSFLSYLGYAPEKDDICKDYWKCFWAYQDKTQSELRDSIHLKAIESYLALEKTIFPKCVAGGKARKLKFVVVIDADPISAQEDGFAELAKRKSSRNNPFDRLKKSLRRIRNSYLYDEVQVISYSEFSQRLKLQTST